MPNLLFCVGKAVADVGLAELVACADGNPMVALGLGAKIAFGAWKQWKEDKKQDKLNADVLDAAKKSFEEAKQAAIDVAKQVTPDPDLQGHVERFVTLVPASIRASLRRPEDPTGTTVPANYAIGDPDDLVKLLPARLPRFKPGDTPPFLRGWRLVEQIGAGGFGEVWKAQNTRAGNLVNAVKFGHGLSEAEQTLMNEGDVLNRILGEGQHDGIVRLLDVWADGDAVPWLRYEYIPGGDLTAQIHQWQRLPAEQRIDRALDALMQIAGTVGHFHTLNPFIVHRDLKPSNILFDPVAKRFKVADFGIGGVSSRRMLSADQSHSLTAGAVVASYLRGSHTPLYASPQQRAGSKLLDPRDDVHALGVIAYQMVTGQLDAAPGSDADHDLEDASAPVGLISLVKACTANKPDRRPKNAAEVVERLKALAHLTPHPPEPVVPPTSPAGGEVGVPRSSPPATLATLPAPPTSPLAGEVAVVSEANPAGGGTAAPLPPPSGANSPRIIPVVRPRTSDIKLDLLKYYDALPQKNVTTNELAQLFGVHRKTVDRWLADHDPERAKQTSRIGKDGKEMRIGGGTPTHQRDLFSFDGSENHQAGERFDLELPGRVKMAFAWCPPGHFLMGSPKSEKERNHDETEHEVQLTRGFFCGVYPVTQVEWMAVMGSNPSHFKGGTLPVEKVSWTKVEAFCKAARQLTKLPIRLPTEAEWEYACRGGTKTTFYWGDRLNGFEANCDGSSPYNADEGTASEGTTPVGSYTTDFPHPWGLADVHGNVWEWCADWYDAGFYSRSPTVDPECKDGEQQHRVLRGGSWNSPCWWCRAAYRYWEQPQLSYNGAGFRVVFNLD